jgi:AraC-like DNA-binding protein
VDIAGGPLCAANTGNPSSPRVARHDEGATFSEYVVAQRLTRAYRMLIDSRAIRTISAIALDVGFGDLLYFNRSFRRRFGATPSEVRGGPRPE